MSGFVFSDIHFFGDFTSSRSFSEKDRGDVSEPRPLRRRTLRAVALGIRAVSVVMGDFALRGWKSPLRFITMLYWWVLTQFMESFISKESPFCLILGKH